MPEKSIFVPEAAWPKKPYMEWLLHIGFWVIYFLYPFLQFSANPDFNFDYLGQLINLLPQLLIVYSYYFGVLPWILKKGIQKKWWIPFLFCLLLLLLAWLSCWAKHQITQCDCSQRICFFNSLLQYIFLVGIFSAFYLFRKFQEKEKEVETTKKEKYLAELESLKAQINPHFLLNTLNAIYSNSIVENSNPKISTSILQFSEILKYTTYEGRQNEVNLRREVEHIQNFVALQLFRLESKVVVKLEKKNISDQLFITPLLLITFVENAFKYTHDLEGENHVIFIKIEEREGTLFFNCKNPYHYSSAISTIKEGIGLSNTFRRLALIYPNKHHIKISDAKGMFIVNLQIDLK